MLLAQLSHNLLAYFKEWLHGCQEAGDGAAGEGGFGDAC